MEVPHGAVPGSGNEGEKDHAAEEVDMSHLLDILLINKEEESGKTGKEKTYGTLGEGGKGGKDIADKIIFPVFRITEIEESDGSTHEEEESSVCNDCF